MPRTAAGTRTTTGPRGGSTQLKMASGTLTGNGTSQSISGLGFQPDLVVVRNDSATANVRMAWRSGSHSGDKTSSFVGAIANFADGVTSLDSDGFSVGSSVVANEDTKTIHYVAFKGTGVSFAYGTYQGDGIDGKTISGLGFQPDLVVVKHDGTGRGRWRTSNVVGDTALAFDNTANSSCANSIQSITSDGFTVGTDATVNTDTNNYYWFAFKIVPSQFKAGTYIGNSIDSRNIGGFGFQPVFIFIKGDDTLNSPNRFPTQVGDSSFNDNGPSASTANAIQAFNADGIQVGTGNNSNKNIVVFYYAAWKVPAAITRTAI